MSERPRNIAEMFEATVARRGGDPALGEIVNGALRWNTWQEIAEQVRTTETALKQNGLGRRDQRIPPKGNAAWIRNDLACMRLRAFAVPHFELSDPQSLTDTTAAIVRTSGTSGEPRTVALSHENLVSNTVAVAETIAASLIDGERGEEDDGEELRLSFLPFHHLYARVCDLYCWIYRGSRMVLAESRETIFRDCHLAQPTTINGVPYFFQKAVDLADRDGVSLRQLLGGRIERCYSGGAALSPALQHRFADEGIPLMNGYGLSEASPVVTVSTLKDHRPGTVGKPLPGVDVRLADDGEVLVRGPNVMLGYWGPNGIDQQATADVIRDGWLHTGDLGTIDEEGFLSIVGRKKELIALSTGKKAAPSALEALLAASPWIEQVAVVGEGRSRLGALIVPNPDRVRAEVRRRRLFVWSKRRALSHAKIRAVFAQEIAARLAGCPAEHQVREFVLIGRPFSADHGEITAKLSLRRAGIEQNFAREIERMYSNSGQSKLAARRS